MEKGYITVQVLKPAGKSIDVAVKKPIDPKEFFNTRTGLYVWEGFKTRIVSKAEKSKAQTYTLASFDLVRTSKDEEIEEALGEKHFFSETDVCAIIAELIAAQPKGKKGKMITTGYANLFYTGSFVVRVGWNAGGGEWLVVTWDRDDDGWSSGNRVFSSAN